MSDEIKSRKENIVKGAYKAVDELIKVLESPIVSGSFGDDLGAEKMKNAAAAKKLAMFDALEMLDKAQEVEDDLNGTETVKKEKKVEKPTDFRSAEERARK